MELKDIIKQRRLELKLSMGELSKLVGVSEATISRWESGDIENMRRDKIALLSKALDISPLIIMGYDNDLSTNNKSKLKSIARLENADITEREDEQIADYIEFIKQQRKK